MTDDTVEKVARERAKEVVAAIQDLCDIAHGNATAWCPDEAEDLIAHAISAALAAMAGERQASEDARLYGAGFLTVLPDGRREHLPAQAVKIDIAALRSGTVPNPPAARADRDAVVEALQEAREMVEKRSVYCEAYWEKQELDADLAKIDAAIRKLKETT